MRNWIVAALCMLLPITAMAQTGGIVTLYALDPVASAFSFGTGVYGHVVRDGVARNRESDIDFGQYGVDQFSVGVEGSRLGAIVDLGTVAELQGRYGYPETVGMPQGFSSLRMAGGKIVIGANYRTGAVQPLKEAELLAATKATAQKAVIRGHIYLVRITDPQNTAFERIAKFLVLDHQPGASATLRWDLLK